MNSLDIQLRLSALRFLDDVAKRLEGFRLNNRRRDKQERLKWKANAIVTHDCLLTGRTPPLLRPYP